MAPQRQGSARCIALTVLFAAAACTGGFTQEHAIVLELAPAPTSIDFTLEDPLHTVRGAFNLKHGEVRYDPASGVVSGEIVVDTTSGHSGSNARDSRMHREILESAKYPETVFRPVRADGKLEAQGASTLQVHGMLNIHGADHEITIPVQVEMAQNRWTTSAHFEIPYVKWGIKNPSNFFACKPNGGDRYPRLRTQSLKRQRSPVVPRLDAPFLRDLRGISPRPPRFKILPFAEGPETAPLHSRAA